MNRSHHERPVRPCLRLIAALLVTAPIVALAMSSPSTVNALALGRGNYELMASVFGTESDGLVGEVTSSGRTVKAFDRMVALPACTESSCPWLDLDADADGRWGAQTECAEANGFCWVQISLPETGACAVAPVIDRGPLFVRDNWWDLRRNRTYYLKRGLPAAEAARDGADLGFGPGISDAGYDIANVYTYAAAIDLGAGTWVDLGLDPDQGISEVRVKLLWQAGVNHLDACDGAYGNGFAAEDVNLRSGPSTSDDVLTVVPPGRRLSIVSPIDSGFYQVDVDGLRGWVHADYLAPDDGRVGDTIAIVEDEVNFREGPSTADDIIEVVPEGTAVVITGAADGAFLPVKLNETTGWIAADYLDLGDANTPDDDDDNDNGAGDGTIAVTTDDVNFRTGPSLTAGIHRVLPAGTLVTLTGDEDNGFASAQVGSTGGWISTDYLMVSDETGETMRVTESLNLRSGPSTADTILLVMPAGARVTLTGARQNNFLAVSYAGKDGWAYADYLE